MCARRWLVASSRPSNLEPIKPSRQRAWASDKGRLFWWVFSSFPLHTPYLVLSVWKNNPAQKVNLVEGGKVGGGGLWLRSGNGRSPCGDETDWSTTDDGISRDGTSGSGFILPDTGVRIFVCVLT